jgi:hypothetical protein
VHTHVLPQRAVGLLLALSLGAPWNAYEQVRVKTRAEWYALSDACPAFPPEITVD